MCLLNFSYQSGNKQINLWGHLGGLLVGFFTLFIIQKPKRANDGVCCTYPTWLITSSVLLGGFLLIGFTLFYTLDYYK